MGFRLWELKSPPGPQQGPISRALMALTSGYCSLNPKPYLGGMFEGSWGGLGARPVLV